MLTAAVIVVGLIIAALLLSVTGWLKQIHDALGRQHGFQVAIGNEQLRLMRQPITIGVRPEAHVFDRHAAGAPEPRAPEFEFDDKQHLRSVAKVLPFRHADREVPEVQATENEAPVGA